MTLTCHNSIPRRSERTCVNQTKVENISVIFDFELQTEPAKQRTEEAAEQSSNFKREDLLLYHCAFEDVPPEKI